MPLNSIQQYVKGLLDGLVFQDGIAALQAYVQPPVLDTLDAPKAYIWGGRMRGRRQTMPRVGTPAAINSGQSGFKRLDWTVDVYLSYEMNPDVPATTLDQDFPLIIDAVLTKTWTTVMPTFITDSVTGVISQVLAIGEDFELEYPPERMPSTLQMIYYTARLGLDIYEAVQA
jgi:hypothetical protein